MLIGASELTITKETLKEALQLYFNEHVFAKDRAPIISKIEINGVELDRFVVKVDGEA